MSPQELVDAIDTLSWSQRGLAATLSADDRLVRRWISAEKSVPPAVANWLRRLVAAHGQNPVPEDWRRRSAAQGHANI